LRSNCEFATHTVRTTVPVGLAPEGVLVSGDGRQIYVTNYDANTVSVIDSTTNSVIATVPVDDGPVAIAVANTPDDVFENGFE
jgi:YVTN family beta-propeller protein